MNVFFNIVYDSYGYWWSVEQTVEETALFLMSEGNESRHFGGGGWACKPSKNFENFSVAL
jgi:hypothetical protein